MIRHMLQRLIGSLTGHKPHGRHGHHGHGNGHGYYGNKHYSSSDYKKGNYYPPQQPPYGHGHYKKRHSSFSS
ncbi:hypothetical protein [Paenibacillus sp. MMS18-CY102]|uniref:hypothetical protein n=1 Tax=Paenibacillus sp. MMS18-CY102 TaxID=2682849 RepID=UPI0013654B20|nr:hypothetical protein [Paenibacillus sp. MMS18-CY102]MWC30756.1 hypothetical protein [Paenibacillus sp. MMS18-CY102]